MCILILARLVNCSYARIAGFLLSLLQKPHNINQASVKQLKLKKAKVFETSLLIFLDAVVLVQRCCSCWFCFLLTLHMVRLNLQHLINLFFALRFS